MVYKCLNLINKCLILIVIMLITSGCSMVNMFRVYSQDDLEKSIDEARMRYEIQKQEENKLKIKE